MIDYCPGCKSPVRWYHRKGVNSSWHRTCWASWDRGHSVAYKFCTNENLIVGYKTPGQLYRERSNYDRKEEIKG